MNKTRIALALLMLPLAAAAQVYRWTDDKGQVHYTQTPPPGEGTKAKSVESTAPAATSNPGMDALKNYNAKTDAENAAAAKKQAEEKKYSSERDKRCQQAQANVNVMQSTPQHRVGQKNEDGSVTRMSEEQYNDNLAESKAAAARYCKPG